MRRSPWNLFSLARRRGTPRLEPSPHGRLPLPSNELSTTVFTGSAPEWFGYLQMTLDQRYDPAWSIKVDWDGQARKVSFQGANECSKKLADALADGLQVARELLSDRPFALRVLDELLYSNSCNEGSRLSIHVSPYLPSKASLEVETDDQLKAIASRIVLDLPSVEKVLNEVSQYDGKENAKVRLGIIWPLLRRVISQIAYPFSSRDRYIERIDLTMKLAFLNIHVLFKGYKMGRFIPNKTGRIYQAYVSHRDDVSVDHLHDRHPYFKMLHNLSFMLQENWEPNYQEIARVIVRDYLDTRYVRLSIAGVMPAISDTMQPMEMRWKSSGKPSTTRPKVGKFGILDGEDLEAWQDVEKPLTDLGFVPVRQLGIGQYGRVYEGVNYKNGAIPRRVAIKVDRIQKKKKQEAILASETILKIGRDLSYCPHVIRIFDAGKLQKREQTYHVLQLIDGDTLDNLVGITGQEHTSIMRPHKARTSLQELNQEIHSALESSGADAWRKQASLPFVHPLSVSQALDLITSLMLWVEEIHSLKYAVNDLKNANLMVSRRGQLKAIDLDSYAPAFSPLDRRMDFFFLSVSLLLFLFHFRGTNTPDLHLSGLLSDEKKLRDALMKVWPREFFEMNSHIQPEAFTELMSNLLMRSRDGTYSENSAVFAKDVDQLIYLKRTTRGNEVVLD